MVILLRASRARHRVPGRRPALPATTPSSEPGFAKELRLVGRLLALVDGLLAAAGYLDFICSGAWFLPAVLPAPPRPRPPAG